MNYKVFLYISKMKKALPMYQPYINALMSNFDIATQLDDADVVLNLGAWTRQGASIAQQAERMGIPYSICPLGDLSERNRHNPGIKRSIQTFAYQKDMMKKAACLIASTPMEQQYLQHLGWNKNVILIRNHTYTQQHTSLADMVEKWNVCEMNTLSNFEQQKASRIAQQTEDSIARQILQIQSRMPHHNIPQQYLNDLHTLLYADNYDEELLCQELKRLQLTSYSASLFHVMTEKTGLTEGFMPLPAQKNRKSQEISRYIKA